LLSGQIPEPNCIWKTAIGPQWRETLNKGPKARGQVFRTLVDIERVDEFARRAVNELTIPLSSKDGLNDDHDIPSPGSAYYRYSALVDQDLLFLRCDSVCLNSISNLLGTDADGALAHAAEHLLTGEPLS
jgi:hypothetical protein